jgi:hypothetical protein
MAELYAHFSAFNFDALDWRAAAERYLELMTVMDAYTADDDLIDHDALADIFERCEDCIRIRELEDSQEQFWEQFGRIWAENALKGGSNGESEETKPATAV